MSRTELVPFPVHTYGARSHQRGYAFLGDARPSHHTLGTKSDDENADGPIVVHVRNGKPLTAKGRELLRKPN